MSKWIIVEDEPDLYSMLVNLNAVFGVETVGFGDGESSLMWLTSLGKKKNDDILPELALIDIRLPGKVSGVDVSWAIRQTSPLANIPIVLITAYRLTPEEEQDVMMQSDANLLIYKPLPGTKQLRKILFGLLNE